MQVLTYLAVGPEPKFQSRQRVYARVRLRSAACNSKTWLPPLMTVSTGAGTYLAVGPEPKFQSSACLSTREISLCMAIIA